MPTSDLHSIMMEKSALAGEVGSGRAPPFIISTIKYKVVVYAPAEREKTLLLFLLYPYMYSVVVRWKWMQTLHWCARLHSQLWCSTSLTHHIYSPYIYTIQHINIKETFFRKNIVSLAFLRSSPITVTKFMV
jgi:hypothetical protein